MSSQKRITEIPYSISVDRDPLAASALEAITGIKFLGYSSVDAFKSHSYTYPPAAVFVDVHLGLEENGLDLIPFIREKWPYSPILVVTTEPGGDAVGHALAAGADDFLRKPFDAKELVARMRARTTQLIEKSCRDTITFGDFVLNLHLCQLSGPAGSSSMSQSDARLLQYLAQANGMLITRAELKRKLWGNVVVSDNALDKKLHDVRSTLKSTGSCVRLTSSYRQGFSLIIPIGLGQSA